MSYAGGRNQHAAMNPSLSDGGSLNDKTPSPRPLKPLDRIQNIKTIRPIGGRET